MLLFFDCETTGTSIPGKKYNIDTDQMHIASYLVQLSWKLVDNETTIEEVDLIIRPHGYEYIPRESTEIHGITIEMAKEQGHDLVDVLNGPFLRALHQADLVIAHNASFDVKIILFSALRAGCYDAVYHTLQTKPIVCTMYSTRQYCQAKDIRGRLKMPRLDELHTKVFGKAHENAHNARYDVEACHKVYSALENDITWSVAFVQ